MIDLHTHTYFSDGILGPSELVYRAKCRGYTAIGLTDHGDFSNMELIITSITKAASSLEKEYKIKVIPGIEITYVPPRLISKAVRSARKLGAEIVLVHGETPAEQVPPGTNKAALKGGIDILAHPGFITKEEALLAKKNNVLLEITARKGHSRGNPHVASLAKASGADCAFNTDTHMPEDIIDIQGIKITLKNAKLSMNDFLTMQQNSDKLIKKIRG
ncbi:MAG: histidinol phosphate phosphatase domain-containing protein [bacterium]